MAGLGQKFDATNHDTEQRPEYEELPNGIYDLEIEASEVKPTNSGNGTILKTTSVVIAPEEYKGRKLFSNYNLENVNPVAQDIGQKQLASLCRAIGVAEVEDSDELHFQSYRVKVGLGKASKGKDGTDYPARAEIKTYYFNEDGQAFPEPAIDDNQPAKNANDNRAAANDNKPATRPAAASGGAKTTPWGKKAG